MTLHLRLDPAMATETADPGPLADSGLIRELLIASAKRAEPISYSTLLSLLGFRFTRPKMRSLCKTLDRVDQLCAALGEPELAVLVVREADGLPGQGWWTGGHALSLGYSGAWTGPQAASFIRTLHQVAFAYWAAR
jgi:hypothetical protein